MAGAVRVPQRDRDNNAKLTANLQCCQLRKAHNAPIGGGLYRRSRIRNETRARCCARADPLFTGRIRRAISVGARYRSRRYSRTSERG